MRLYGLLLCGWMAVSLQAQQIHDWENHHVLQINREPARAAFVPFAKQKGDCSMSLDGMWKFRWTPVPSERIADFYRTDFNDEDWKEFSGSCQLGNQRIRNTYLCIGRISV